MKRYYTWEAHTKKYLDEIEKMLERGLNKVDTFAPVGKKLFTAEKLIVTDIDNTLLGDINYANDFTRLLKNRQEKIGFAVATGRTIESTLKVLKENNIPHPDVIISSVGSEIYYNHEGKLIPAQGWKAHISFQWDREKVATLLNRFFVLSRGRNPT